jgi:hypothetical protein
VLFQNSPCDFRNGFGTRKWISAEILGVFEVVLESFDQGSLARALRPNDVDIPRLAVRSHLFCFQ